MEWFKRALRIDRKCLAAWTLMGHEFLEMRNCGEDDDKDGSHCCASD